MKKILMAVLAIAAVLVTSVSSVLSYEALNGPTGLLKYASDKAYNGYTLFAPTGAKENFAYLIDMEGNLVHKWKLQYKPGLFAKLLENGNLLVGGQLPKPPLGFGGVSGTLQELDWDGKVVWEYKMMSPTEVSHHSFTRLPNGNTMIQGWEFKSIEEAIRKGRKPETIPPSVFDRGIWHTGFWSDFVREVDRAGKTVWEWHAWDHIGVGPTKLDINYMLPEPVGTVYWNFDWSHANTVEYIAESDEVIVNFRNAGEFVVINHKSGEIVWRWGNPCAYGQGKCPSYYNDGDQKMFGTHHVTYLGKDIFQAFDNGSERPEGNRSRVVQVDRKTGKVVWEYYAKDSTSFFSYRQGSADYLPNGNVLVTSTHHGHLFEVTKGKQIAWEYVSPFFAAGKFCSTEDGSSKNAMSNMIHRSYRYGADYPGLKGKDLKPVGVLNEGCPEFWKVYKLDK